jgi:uncharacterized protein
MATASSARPYPEAAAETAVIRQRWEDLLFLHWRVRNADLKRRLPRGLELDTYNGHSYVGLVPFTVPMNRLAWVPAPLSPGFHEVNLRTYVKGPDGEAAVWFFSLDASSRWASLAAATLFFLPYHHARIEFGRERNGHPGDREWIRFVSRRVKDGIADCAVRYGPAGLPRTADAGTLEHFLIERYVLYAWTGSSLVRGTVRHEPYPVQEAELDGLEEGLFRSAGLTRPKLRPLAHYARGVTVDICWPKRQQP